MNTQSYMVDNKNHFADAVAGDVKYYGIELSQWLTAENDTLVSATWTADAGVTISLQTISATQARCKIATPTAGVYKITCVAQTTEGAATQTKSTILWLSVYDR